MSHATPVVIRRLAKGDVDLFRGLLRTFARVFGEEGYQGPQPRTEYLQDILGGDRFIALAALEDGAIIGGLAAYELRKFEREASEIYIYDLAVDANHRRKGVATRLIGQLRSIAAARGAYVIFVQADHGDGPAIALYSKLGTREDVLHFDIAVE